MMDSLSRLPQAGIDLAVAVLLRLILPVLNDDETEGRTLALAMLAEYQPRSIQELHMAAESIGLGLNTLHALAECAQPGASPRDIAAARRAACSLSRAEAQAHRRYNMLRNELPAEATAHSLAAAAPDVAPHADSVRTQRSGSPPDDQPPGVQAEIPAPSGREQEVLTDSGSSPVAVEEAIYAAAVMRLNLMKARYKGAPPPHSKAAQDIQAQQRLVNMALIKLQQARRCHAAQSVYATAELAA